MNFSELITLAIDLGASDLHLSSGRPASCRVDGKMMLLNDIPLLPADIKEISDAIMTEHQRAILSADGQVDFAYSIAQKGRFRINVFYQRGTAALVARILNLTIPSAQQLGIPLSVVDIIHKRRGLVLVTGATGSGKSTTLACLVDMINKTYPYHVITLEEPIEYLHHHNKSIVNQRELGDDFKSFSSALRAALRQDPDVILVGEMRDLDTISIAVTAAETGHLVFSTLHTVGASNTIDRIIDVFPPYQQQQIRTQLAEVLECVVSQQLLPKQSGHGRVAAMEVMLANSAIRSHIRDGKTFQIQTVLQTNRKAGMQTMDDALYDLYLKGDITQESAISFAQNAQNLTRRISGF
ncbi:MAG: type IV pilus twitching motility protein PilT [Evtepia sp.]